MTRAKQIEGVFEERFAAAREWCQIADVLRSHSVMVARAARTVAEQMTKNGVTTVDSELAYQAGLMHDIGKADPAWTGLNHIVLGYKALLELGWDDLAQIAMTHTYYGYDKVDRQEFWEEFDDPAELKLTQDYMATVELTDLDLLLQLVDNMAHAVGIMSISDRFCDILIRHGIRNAGEHLKELYRLKLYFDEKCGMNIYLLFKDEIIRTALEEPNDKRVIEMVRAG